MVWFASVFCPGSANLCYARLTYSCRCVPIVHTYHFDFRHLRIPGLKRVHENTGACRNPRSALAAFLFPGAHPPIEEQAWQRRPPVTPLGVIRSQRDLQRYLSSHLKLDSPLNALSRGARERFLSSITFNEKGITGFHYADLQTELTASQMRDVLHLFGVEKTSRSFRTFGSRPPPTGGRSVRWSIRSARSATARTIRGIGALHEARATRGRTRSVRATVSLGVWYCGRLVWKRLRQSGISGPRLYAESLGFR